MSPVPLNDNARHWARLELYRWQHGDYPENGDPAGVDPVAGAHAMAEAMEQGNPARFPTVEMTINVLRFLAEELGAGGSGADSASAHKDFTP